MNMVGLKYGKPPANALPGHYAIDAMNLHPADVMVLNRHGGCWTRNYPMEVHLSGVGADGARELRVATVKLPRPTELKAVRVVLRAEFPEAPEPVMVHHAAFPRMLRRMVARGDEPWVEQGKRTNFCAAEDFDLRVGEQASQMHPAFVVFREGVGGWLLGPMSETNARWSYGWRMAGLNTLVLEIEWNLWGVDSIAVPPDMRQVFDSFYVQEFDAGVPFGPAWFEGYSAEVARRMPGASGARRPAVRESALAWGTWNDHNYRQIDHASILAQARWQRENLPQVQWVQVDDGWAPESEATGPVEASKCVVSGMSDLGVFYRREYLEQADARFPRGMKGLADDIKALGLRPAIWLTPAVSATSPLFREKPHWFLPGVQFWFTDALRFPDFSIPEVRAYVQRALDRVFGDWGFEGCKLDFWSLGFESANTLQCYRERTSLEWLHWLAAQVRKRLPSDGYFSGCIDISMGNPFRGAYFDNCRYGPDVDFGAGRALFVKEAAYWLAYLNGLARVGEYFWTPNGDGLGVFDSKAWPDRFWRLTAAYLMGGGALVECCGRLWQQADHPRAKVLARLLGLVRRSGRTRCPGYRWADVVGRPPVVWVREHRDHNVVALVNTGEEPVEVEVSAGTVGALWPNGVALEDVLTGARLRFPCRVRVDAEDGVVLAPA